MELLKYDIYFRRLYIKNNTKINLNFRMLFFINNNILTNNIKLVFIFIIFLFYIILYKLNNHLIYEKKLIINFFQL